MKKCMIGYHGGVITTRESKEAAIKFLNEELFPNNTRVNSEYCSDLILYKEHIWIQPIGEEEYPFLEDGVFPEDLTVKQALKRAEEFDLVYEVQQSMNKGLTPAEACREWDV
jgi:hypothetical protein